GRQRGNCVAAIRVQRGSHLCFRKNPVRRRVLGELDRAAGGFADSQLLKGSAAAKKEVGVLWVQELAVSFNVRNRLFELALGAAIVIDVNRKCDDIALLLDDDAVSAFFGNRSQTEAAAVRAVRQNHIAVADVGWMNLQ